MAKVHIDPEALKVWRKFPNSKESLRFTTAAHKVQSVFCTYRESILASSIWSGTFMQELLTRPFLAETYVIQSPFLFSSDTHDVCT